MKLRMKLVIYIHNIYVMAKVRMVLIRMAITCLTLDQI
jgi:hypothetical protein